jgi:hypothetical protein
MRGRTAAMAMEERDWRFERRSEGGFLRKEKVIYSKLANRQAVGCRRNGSRALHVEQRVRWSINYEATRQALQRVCQ